MGPQLAERVDHTRRLVARRWFLKECGVGLGAIGLADLLGLSAAAAPKATDPLTTRQPPFTPKAKSVIYLFMAGGPSHLELFDNKPELARWDGKLPPPDLVKNYRAAFINPNSKLLGPKFKFARHGKSGAELSELLPHLATQADDLCIVKSMVTDAFNHAPAQIFMNTGAQQFGRPSLGAWTLYGLGSESKDLPGFVVFSTGSKGPSGGNSNWGSGFLPTVYQGVQFRTGSDPVLYLSSPRGVDRGLQRDTLDGLGELNRLAWDQHGGLVGDLKKNCRNTDQACAALLRDLKSRGLLDSTLVIWGGEFGRTPMVQGGSDGRDHHPNCFTMWLAGGGVKPGVTIGESDAFGFHVTRDKVHVHDLHATILHLLGFDHEKLTYRFQGRDFRLTDVHGKLVKQILA
ncbi:MAG: DUF1501 domain-containing protein [Planctomycetes bacterium]|nr:DUF1501 domain-containing protein [Planctomycetota bacterium]